MSLLVKDEDLIPITVYYTEKKNSRGTRIIKVIEEKKAKELLQQSGGESSVKVINTKWRQQTWSAQQKLYTDAAMYNPATGLRETDWPTYSDLQVKTCLAAWDVCDDEGREYPLTPEYIDRLPANVANELLAQYRRATMLEDGEGN